jgi:hypothetical protein
MTVTFGTYEFDDVDYDAEFDVLRLRRNAPGPVTDDDHDVSREDFLVIWSEGEIVMIEVMDPRRTLGRGDEVVVTLRDGTVLHSPDVHKAIVPRAAA